MRKYSGLSIYHWARWSQCSLSSTRTVQLSSLFGRVNAVWWRSVHRQMIIECGHWSYSSCFRHRRQSRGFRQLPIDWYELPSPKTASSLTIGRRQLFGSVQSWIQFCIHSCQRSLSASLRLLLINMKTHEDFFMGLKLTVVTMTHVTETVFVLLSHTGFWLKYKIQGFFINR